MSLQYPSIPALIQTYIIKPLKKFINQTHPTKSQSNQNPQIPSLQTYPAIIINKILNLTKPRTSCPVRISCDPSPSLPFPSYKK